MRNTVEVVVAAFIEFLKQVKAVESETNFGITNIPLKSSIEFNQETLLDQLEKLIKNLNRIKDKIIIDEESNGLPPSYETDQSVTCDPKLVQICVSRKEIDRRISAFSARKRKEVDNWNVQEFCGRIAVDENHPLWESQDTCARVDAINMPLYGKKSHAKVSVVNNIFGPQTRPKQAMEEAEKQNHFNSNIFNGIDERIKNMELHLKMKTDHSVPQDIYSKLKRLEDRILFLEGISLDYFVPTRTSTKRRKPNELDVKCQNWSVSEIDKRLEQLSNSLKVKSSSLT